MSISRIENVPRKFVTKSHLDIQIEMYKKQKDAILKRMEKISNDESLDDQTKSSSVYSMKKAIQDINVQIEQLQLQRIQEMSMKADYIREDEERDRLLREQAEDLGVIYTPSMSGVIEADNKIEISQSINRSQTKLKGEINVAENEASSIYAPSKSQAKRLAKLKSVKSMNDHQLVDVMLDSNDLVKETRQREVEDGQSLWKVQDKDREQEEKKDQKSIKETNEK